MMENARPDDAPALQRMFTTVFSDNFIVYSIYQSPQSASFLRTLIEKPESNYIRVLRESGEMIGFTQSSLQEHEVFWAYMGLLPEHEGKGLGKVMLEDVVEYARATGRVGVTLDVFEDNVNPYRWYLKRGFVEK